MFCNVLCLHTVCTLKAIHSAQLTYCEWNKYYQVKLQMQHFFLLETSVHDDGVQHNFVDEVY